MPELPEVETVRQGLLPIVKKKIIIKLDQRRPDLRWTLPKNMSSRLENTKICNISRRSKYLLFQLSSGETLIVHLGMSGRLLVLHDIEQTTTEVGSFNFKTHKYDKHDHIVMYLDSGIRVVYNDPRRFGAMDLISTLNLDNHKWLKKLGPEPLGNYFFADYLFEKLQKRKSSIKTSLMDQKIIAGLGNIYVLEVLWLCKIAPSRTANDLKMIEVERLIVAIRNVLARAIKAGGTSLQDFRRVGGELGYFQQRLQVYGRHKQQCKNIDCLGTIQRVKQLGRMSYYCDQCQK